MFTPELVHATMQEREREFAQLQRVAPRHERGAVPRSGPFLERI